MINNSNHIDNWLQQSASLGKTPFDNVDWMAMQQLLEKKRRRKILIIWFVIGIMALIAALAFLLNNNTTTKQTVIKNNTANSNNNAATANEHQTPKNNQQIDTAQSISLNNNNTTGNTTTADVNKNNEDKAAFNKPLFNMVDDERRIVENSDVKHSTKGIAAKSDNKKQVAVVPDKTDNNNLNNITDTDVAIPKKQYTNNNVDDVLNKIQNSNNNSISKGYLPEIKYMHNRYIGSLKNTVILSDSGALANETKKQIPKEDSTKNLNKSNAKKTTKQKNYLEVGVGFASLNIANEIQTGLIKLNFSIPFVKNLYVDIGSKAFLFNAAQTQTHTNIYDIQQTAGTINKTVFFRQTAYAINNGVGIEPGIGLHYQFNKINIGAAFNYGMVLNKSNNTKAYTDTMLPTFLLPITIPASNVKIGGGSYDNKNFIGKSYSTISVSCSYALNNKWKLQASYANLFWYNKVEGVLDESKKRNSFYFTVGYRF